MRGEHVVWIDREDENSSRRIFRNATVFRFTDQSEAWILSLEIQAGDRVKIPGALVRTHPYTIYDGTEGNRYRVLLHVPAGQLPDFTGATENWPPPTSWDSREVLAMPEFTPNASDIGPVNDRYYEWETDLARATAPVAAANAANTTKEGFRSGMTEMDETPAPPPVAKFDISDITEYLERDDPDPAVVWWIQQAYDEATQTLKKAHEYGSTELVYAGRVMAQVHSRMEDRELSDMQAAELQIYQYVLGKMGRWTAAMRRGEFVSDDTLLDIGVYVRMVQKMRSTGTWP